MDIAALMFSPYPKPEKSEKKKVKPLRKRTAKRAGEERQYSKERKVFLLANPVCKRCSGKASDAHHQKGRIGSLLLDKRFWIPVCRSCHDWITEFSTAAIEQGYSFKRNA